MYLRTKSSQSVFPGTLKIKTCSSTHVLNVQVSFRIIMNDRSSVLFSSNVPGTVQLNKPTLNYLHTFAPSEVTHPEQFCFQILFYHPFELALCASLYRKFYPRRSSRTLRLSSHLPYLLIQTIVRCRRFKSLNKV